MLMLSMINTNNDFFSSERLLGFDHLTKEEKMRIMIRSTNNCVCLKKKKKGSA